MRGNLNAGLIGLAYCCVSLKHCGESWLVPQKHAKPTLPAYVVQRVLAHVPKHADELHDSQVIWNWSYQARFVVLPPQQLEETDGGNDDRPRWYENAKQICQKDGRICISVYGVDLRGA